MNLKKGHASDNHTINILIYGSTFLTGKVCAHLIEKEKHIHLVGYIPNTKEPTVPGVMPIDKTSETVPHDIKISIQYDAKIVAIENSYNVHTGLLPLWGGSDILYHTLKRKARMQGLTFHKMSERFDYGPIVSKITYPVFPEDTILDLYERLALICPYFVASSIRLLQSIGIQKSNQCIKKKPTFYRRGNIAPEDIAEYLHTKAKLRKTFF